MTRRIIAYRENGKYYISQEFNGGRTEIQTMWNGRDVPLKADWEDIVSLFDGTVTLNKFKLRVEEAEDLYSYENLPLNTTVELPSCEEIWIIIDSKLKLYSQYGEAVK